MSLHFYGALFWSVLFLIVKTLIDALIFFSIRLFSELQATSLRLESSLKLLQSLSFIAALVLVLMLFYRSRKKEGLLISDIFLSIKESLQKKSVAPLSLLPLLVFFPIAVQITGSAWLEWLIDLFPILDDEAVARILKPDGTLLDRVGAYFTIVLIAPICEEIFFREFLYRSLERGYGSKRAALFIQGVLFGLSHVFPAQIIYAVPLGWFLGYIRIKKDSLLAPILFHAANNFIALLLLYEADKNSPFELAEGFSAQTAILIFSGIALFSFATGFFLFHFNDYGFRLSLQTKAKKRAIPESGR